ncbi:MAG: hypothetical protein EXR78_03005 [Deltaproteobacteria bacterium]|nr:hypothetical protein [Deltaproteobacteria bacterium]
MTKRTKNPPLRARRPLPPRREDHTELVKALILKGLDAFEASFRRQYPELSQEALRDRMTAYLSERTRFDHAHPKRSFRYGRYN